MLLLIAGIVWSAPFVVRLVAGLGRKLPLSGRFAFRDAARHRFRTAAAAVALTITVAGTIFTGFVIGSVAASVASEAEGTPPNSMSINMCHPEQARDPQQVEQMVATVERVVGPVTTHFVSDAQKPGRRYASLGLRQGRGSYAMVTVVDEDTLRYLIDDDNAQAFETFRSGGVVAAVDRLVPDGHAKLALYPGARKPQNQWQRPAGAVKEATGHATGEFSRAWISHDTAPALGLVAVPTSPSP